MDKILTVFTQDQGKIHVKAKGVRKITSRRSPHLELLNISSLTLYKGKYLPLLIEAQAIENFQEIKSDLVKVGFAYHICELIDGLCAENQENRRVFLLLHQALQRLSSGTDLVLAIHEFEVELLTLLGFWSAARPYQNFDTHYFIENILERRLKSKTLFARLS